MPPNTWGRTHLPGHLPGLWNCGPQLGRQCDVPRFSTAAPPLGARPHRGAPRPQQPVRPSATQLGGSVRPACRPGSAAPAPRSAGVFPLPGRPQSRPASLRAKAPRRKPEPRGADSFLKRLAPALAFLKSSGDAIPASLPPRVVFTPRAARLSSPPAGGARRSGVQPEAGNTGCGPAGGGRPWAFVHSPSHVQLPSSRCGPANRRIELIWDLKDFKLDEERPSGLPALRGYLSARAWR